MPVTKVGVIYSKAQNLRRSVIVCGNDDSQYEQFKSALHPNEGWLDIPLEDYASFTLDPNDITAGAYALDAYIAQILGAPPSSDKCAVINGEDIVSVCCADPSIDEHPDGWIIQDDAAQVGGIYDFDNAMAVPQ